MHQPTQNIISAVGFDLHGVIIQGSRSYYEEHVARRLGVELVRIRAAMAQLLPDYDSGRLTPEEFWTRLIRDLGVEVPLDDLMRAWTEHYSNRSPVRPEMLKLVDELRAAGYRVGLLSNLNPEHAAILKERGILGHFDAALLSDEIGAIKPQPLAYRTLLQALKVEAEELVFTDDLQTNIDGAAALGIRGVLFKGYAPLVLSLRDLGIKI